MKIEIFKLFGSILVDNDKANESIAKTDKKAEGVSGKFLKGAKTAGKWGLAIGGAAAAVGGAMYAMAGKAGDAADRLLDLKAITGMTTDEIQKWEKVTKIAGVSTEAMTNASTKLTKSLDTMSVEGHKGQEALEAMGLSLSDIENMDADERMNVLTEALAGVEDKTDRATYGADIFGGTWKEIAPIVDMGTEAMNKAKDSANIVDEEKLNKANEFRIRIAELKDQFSFFFMELSMKVIPILTDLWDWVSQYTPQIQAFFSTAFEFISEAISIGIEWIGKLINWLKDWYDNNQETIEGIKDGFTDFVNAVVNLIEGFVNIFTKIWENYGDDITKFITNAFELIKSVFSGAFDLIVDIFNVFASLFKGDWSQLWEDVKTLASNLWDSIKGIIKNAINTVVDIFASINLYSIGKNIIQGLINGISNMIGAVKRKVQEVASAIGDNIKGFFGINSPSKLMMEYGGNIGEGLAVGVEDSKDKVTKATESMAGASASVMDRGKNSVVGIPNTTSQPEYVQTNVFLDGKQIATATSRPNRERVNTRNRGVGLSPA